MYFDLVKVADLRQQKRRKNCRINEAVFFYELKKVIHEEASMILREPDQPSAETIAALSKGLSMSLARSFNGSFVVRQQQEHLVAQ